jgi:hypothetical protein
VCDSSQLNRTVILMVDGLLFFMDGKSFFLSVVDEDQVTSCSVLFLLVSLVAHDLFGEHVWTRLDAGRRF